MCKINEKHQSCQLFVQHEGNSDGKEEAKYSDDGNTVIKSKEDNIIEISPG